MFKPTSNEQVKLAEYWLQHGNLHSAQTLLLEIVQQEPGNFRAVELLANLFANQNHIPAAVNLLEKNLNNPDCTYSALFFLGDLYLESGQARAAVNAYKAALTKVGPFFEGLHNLGLAHSHLFQFKEAAEVFQEAVSLNPNSFEAQINFGACLKNLGEYDKSLHHLNIAKQLSPNDARVFLNTGVTLEAMNKLEEALAYYEQAVALSPMYVEAFSNQANTLLTIGKYDEANIAFQKALSIQPNDPNTLYNLSRLQLAQENYQEGWKNYESRWLREDAPPSLFNSIPRLSAQENIDGKHILIWCEQGLGDSIQFARYVLPLKQRGAHITLAVQPQLIELLSGLAGIDSIMSYADEAPAECDFQIPLMSLPFFFMEASIPEPIVTPYLKSNPTKSQLWQARLKCQPKLKVGLVWNGGFLPGHPKSWAINERRNIPLATIAQLHNTPGIEFISLQKGEPSESELISQKGIIWPSDNLSIYSTELANFSDTAALIESLDLVISVDTAVAHLAGALGKPLWILNRYDSCWRWPINQECTHWYPTARIFTQPRQGDWQSVIEKVASELRHLV